MWRWGALLLAGCAARVSPDTLSDAMARQGEPARGGVLYLEHCARCHGDDGRGVRRADLTDVVPDRTDEDLYLAVLSGPGTMPSFRRLDPQDVADLVAYVRRDFTPPPALTER